MTRAEKIAAFDPNDAGADNGQFFGLPFTAQEAAVGVIMVPWDATTSFHSGTRLGPKAVLEASAQVDLYDAFLPNAWHYGIAAHSLATDWNEENVRIRKETAHYLARYEHGDRVEDDPELARILMLANTAHEQLREEVANAATALIEAGKVPAVLGGEHSVPLGLLDALAARHEGFGILQIDAHLDLRNAYEGFEQSHASIMYNALKLPEVKRLVSVGPRDYCEAEAEVVANNPDRISLFSDGHNFAQTANGSTWQEVVAHIIAELPEKVYVSFDIDGLEPSLCPNTGTPVPGGLMFQQAVYLLHEVARERTIIGFDLCEVAPGHESLPDNQRDWDGNVGARILYLLANSAVASQPKAWRSQYAAV